MGSRPTDPNLDRIWRELGVVRSEGGVAFDDTAQLAATRIAIMRGMGAEIH
jgi:hypothetical protein